MSHTNNQSINPSYDPLPLTNDDHLGDTLYNAGQPPPSPTFHTPQFDTPELPLDDSFPPGAARPRFLGAAMYDGSGPDMRNSYASSHQTFPSVDRASEYSSSVYELNAGAAPLSQYPGAYSDDPNASDPYLGSRGDLPMSPVGRSRYLEEKRATYAEPRSKRKVIIWAVVICAILLIAAVMIPLYFAVIRPKNNSSSNGSSSSADSSSPTGSTNGGGGKSALAVVTGGDGSTVTTDDDSTFTYKNSFGGTWYWDANDPFNNGAQAQSWSPALNETFKYGTDRIRGFVCFLFNLNFG